MTSALNPILRRTRKALHQLATKSGEAVPPLTRHEAEILERIGDYAADLHARAEMLESTPDQGSIEAFGQELGELCALVKTADALKAGDVRSELLLTVRSIPRMLPPLL